MKARYTPYPKYKVSGVEWLGQIPGHWEIKRLKYVAAVNPPARVLAGASSQEQVSYLPMEAIGEYGGLELSRVTRPGDAAQGLTRFRDGDAVLARITP